ncbi:WD40-repeat-containing domain protein [Daedaleopsis nitida]|nr:WD40-repeat-containing domain protein [Daedaleopsis nitida]
MSLMYEESGRLQRGLQGGVSAVAFNSSGSYIAIAGMEDFKVYIWRVADNKLLYTYAGSNSPFLSLEWMPGTTDTVLCGSHGGYISVLRFSSSITEVTGFWAHSFPIENLAAKGVQLISGAHSEVRIWQQLRKDQWIYVRELKGPLTDSKNVEEEIIVMGIHWTKTQVHSSVVIITYMHHGIVIYDAHDWTRLQSIPLSGM